MFFRKREPKSTPPWMIWMMIGFVFFAMLGNQNKSGPVGQSIATASSNLAPKKLFNLEGYKQILGPESLRVKESEAGSGQQVICGQQVKIAYEAFLSDDTPIDTASTNPLSFRVGGGEAMPALVKSVIGMRPGGRRSVLSPANFAYGAEGFSRPETPSDAPVRFEIELLEAGPALPDLNDSPFRVAVIVSGSAPSVQCGDTARVHVTLWDVDGKKLFSTHEKNTPVTFTAGKSEVFLGLEQGVIGMGIGGKRTLIVPPAFQATLHGNPPAAAFPFPNQQTVLVDVESIP